MSAPPPLSSVSVLPSRPHPESLVGRALEDAAFAAATRSSAELLRELLVAEGYEVGHWQALAPESGGRIGWQAEFADPALDAKLQLQLCAVVTEQGSVQVDAQVLDLTEPRAGPVAGVCVASTSPLRDWASLPDPLQRLCLEVDTQMSFIELATSASGTTGTLRAIRVAKSYRDPRSWVPDAARVLLAAMSLS